MPPLKYRNPPRCLFQTERCLLKPPKTSGEQSIPRKQVHSQLELHPALHYRASWRAWPQQVHSTTEPRGHLCPKQSSFLARLVFLVPHRADPSVYFFDALKRGGDADIFEEWVFRGPFRPHNHLGIFKDKFDTVARLDAQTFAHLDRYGDLAFAAYSARSAHLYFLSLQ